MLASVFFTTTRLNDVWEVDGVMLPREGVCATIAPPFIDQYFATTAKAFRGTMHDCLLLFQRYTDRRDVGPALKQQFSEWCHGSGEFAVRPYCLMESHT